MTTKKKTYLKILDMGFFQRKTVYNKGRKKLRCQKEYISLPNGWVLKLVNEFMGWTMFFVTFLTFRKTNWTQ